MEFYQEEKRENDVELHYTNKYKYFFEINIPKGYTPANMEDLNISTNLVVNEVEICAFTSKAELDNEKGKILIKINEDYNAILIDVKYYEKYKDVINAAFDFSEKSILFKKV